MDFLGKHFLFGDQEKKDLDLQNIEFIGLYFSASWCVPCRYFTSTLLDFYNKVNRSKKQMEIILVSRDRSETDFLDYYKKMSWFAIPFWDRLRIHKLATGFSVSRIPTLLIFDNKGKLLSREGVYEIEEYGLNAYKGWVNPASNKFLYRFYGMLKKISFKINSLVSKHQFFFSKEAFKRTYDSLVETDPIFPDFKQPNQTVYRVPHRAPPVQSEKKIIGSQIRMAEYVLKRTKKKFRLRSIFRKNDAAEAQNEANEILQSVVKEIKMDPVLNLPYGFTFDDYIVNTRQEKVLRESSKLEILVNEIFQKLKVRNEFELAMLHRHVFSKKDGENFMERARKVVLQKFLKELAKFRKEDEKKAEKSFERYFENFAANKEFYLSSLKELDISNEDEIFKKLQDKIKPAKIEETAQSMSLEVIEKHVEDGQDHFWQEYKPGYREVYSFDKFFFGNPVTTSCDEEASDPRELHHYNYQVQMMNEEEFEKYQLWRDVKKNYFKNRVDYFTNQHGDEKKKNEEENIFSGKGEGVEEAAKNIDLENFYPKPNFEEIYANIDSLVLNIPITKKEEAPIDKSNPKKKLNQAPMDFMWDKITTKFEKVIPRKYYNIEKSEMMDEEQLNDSQWRPSIIDGVLHEDTIGSFKFERDIFDESVLTKEERLELEIFRQVRKDPFFHHHLVNNLKYFSERMIENSLAIKNLTSPGQPNRDYLNYIDPSDEIRERQLFEKMAELQKEDEDQRKKTLSDKFFCGGRRKTAHAMAIVSPGRGIVKVNHVPIYKYFHEQCDRSMILQPIDIAKIACVVDVSLFVRGGGISAQTQACQMALARCLIKRNPFLKTLFKKLLLIQADRRQVERKHVGHYKARKKFPYKRR